MSFFPPKPESEFKNVPEDVKELYRARPFENTLSFLVSDRLIQIQSFHRNFKNS